MKLKQTFSAVVLGLAAMNIQAAEFVLTDSTKGTDVGDWQVSNSSLGLKSDDRFLLRSAACMEVSSLVLMSSL